MIAAALVLQASMAVPMPPPRTLQSETSDAYELKCTVADEHWKTYKVTFLQSGGRAYLALNSEKRETIFRTEVFSRVRLDETGKLTGMGRYEKMIDKPGYGYSMGPIEMGGAAGRATIRLAEVSAELYAVTIVRIDGADRAPSAGFCNVIVSLQSPLSAAETKDYLAR